MSVASKQGWMLLVLMTALLGCSPVSRKPAEPEETVVPVSQPIQREVREFADFTGRVNAIQSVNIIPRVTGYLVKMPFKEGAEVKADDLLFEIDPRPYQAQLDQALGQIEVFKAQLKLAQTTLARDQTIADKQPNAVSKQQLDQAQAAVEEAEARVKAYESSSEVYKLNLSFTQVRSPIDGMVGRYFMTQGNLVNQDQTQLTTVVSLDPMYVYFEVDELTLVRVRAAINEGRIKRPEVGKIPLLMGLQLEEGFPHEGTVDFVNNQINPATGSILVRGVFPNPKPADGVRLLSPGMFVRVRLPIGEPQSKLLVIDRAVTSDQGLKYVYVVDSKDEVQSRRVKTGPLQEDGLRVIVDGLQPHDSVVVGGLQQVRPRMKVQTEEVTMPTLSGRSDFESIEAADTRTDAKEASNTGTEERVSK